MTHIKVYCWVAASSDCHKYDKSKGGGQVTRKERQSLSSG